jgi:hypothetical protein
MSYSLSSARRLAAGAVGASAVAGAMLFGATPAANAAPAHIPAVVGPAHVATAPAFIAPQPAFWGHHGGFGHHHGFFRHHHRGFFGHHHRGFFRGHHHRGWW